MIMWLGFIQFCFVVAVHSFGMFEIVAEDSGASDGTGAMRQERHAGSGAGKAGPSPATHAILTVLQAGESGFQTFY